MSGQRRFSFFGKNKRKEAIRKQRDLYTEEDREGRYHQHQQHFDDESENDLYYRIDQVERSQREERERFEKQERQLTAILQNQQKILENQQTMMSMWKSPQKPTQTVSLSRATGMSQALQLRQPQQKPTPLVAKAATGR